MSSFHSTDGSARFSSDSGEGLGRYGVSPSPDVPGDVEMGSPNQGHFHSTFLIRIGQTNRSNNATSIGAS